MDAVTPRAGGGGRGSPRAPRPARPVPAITPGLGASILLGPNLSCDALPRGAPLDSGRAARAEACGLARRADKAADACVGWVLGAGSLRAGRPARRARPLDRRRGGRRGTAGAGGPRGAPRAPGDRQCSLGGGGHTEGRSIDGGARGGDRGMRPGLGGPGGGLAPPGRETDCGAGGGRRPRAGAGRGESCGNSSAGGICGAAPRPGQGRAEGGGGVRPPSQQGGGGRGRGCLKGSEGVGAGGQVARAAVGA
jgi:hypothetical protein